MDEEGPRNRQVNEHWKPLKPAKQATNISLTAEKEEIYNELIWALSRKENNFKSSLLHSLLQLQSVYQSWKTCRVFILSKQLYEANNCIATLRFNVLLLRRLHDNLYALSRVSSAVSKFDIVDPNVACKSSTTHTLKVYLWTKETALLGIII